MEITRRSFLASVSALAIAPSLPAIAIPASVPVTAAAKPLTTIWVGGHSGEMDWHPFHALTKDDAMRQLLWHHGYTEEDAPADLCLDRAPKMDGKLPEKITGADWVEAGLMSYCDRCSNETGHDSGGCVIEGEVICEDCTTLVDKLTDNPEGAEEDLVELLADHDCDVDDVKAFLSSDNDISLIPEELWQRALEQAREFA